MQNQTVTREAYGPLRLGLSRCRRPGADSPALRRGWNDGSRLATVECVVDHHTWAIDDSIYVELSRAARQPYAPDSVAATTGLWTAPHRRPLLFGQVPRAGLSHGRSLSALALGWRVSAAERPDWFARLLTWVFASIPYLLAVVGIAWITQHIGVPAPGTSF